MGDKKISNKACISFVELIKSLLGAPPELSHVMALMDCLILLHPVDSTYITNDKTSFYFLISFNQTYGRNSGINEYKLLFNRKIFMKL